MKVEQIYQIVNDITEEVTGKTGVVNEDLTNIVDVGKTLLDNTTIDNYVKSLVNHIGKVIFVDRPYRGQAPSVLMDGWEFGSVLEKIKGELPDAEENESWELEDRKSYDPNVFYKPKVSAKFYNSKVTFEVPISITEMQVKESFSSAAQLNGFFSMIQGNVEKALTIKQEALIRSTINSFTADTVFDAFGAAPTGEDSTARAVNLLALYKKEIDPTSTMTKAEAIVNPEFIRFAAYKMDLYVARLQNASTLFNMGGNVRFTPKDLLHIVMLAEFKSAASVYLQSDTYNQDLTALPEAETLTFWQGSGTDYDFSSTSKINTTSGSGKAIEMDGILAVMFDRDALGVTNQNRRTTSNYNAKAEFINNFHKVDASYFNDGDENFVVFFVA